MDLEYEIEIIMKLFNESRIYGYNLNYSLENYFDQECIHLWKNRKYVTSSKQMRERLGVTDEDIRAGLDDKQILVLLEYILNVMSLCDAYMPEASEWSKEFGMLEQNVLNIVTGDWQGGGAHPTPKACRNSDKYKEKIEDNKCMRG